LKKQLKLCHEGKKISEEEKRENESLIMIIGDQQPYIKKGVCRGISGVA